MTITVSRKDFRQVRIPDDNTLEDGTEAIGIRAHVDLHVPYGADNIIIPIETPGLWGIEHYVDDYYADEVFDDECDTLVTILEELGVTVVD